MFQGLLGFMKMRANKNALAANESFDDVRVNLGTLPFSCYVLHVDFNNLLRLVEKDGVLISIHCVQHSLDRVTTTRHLTPSSNRTSL